MIYLFIQGLCLLVFMLCESAWNTSQWDQQRLD